MSGHEAYRGVTVDHLYQDCPSLKRAVPDGEPGYWRIGRILRGEVDPFGTYICGLCRRRYEREISDGDS